MKSHMKLWANEKHNITNAEGAKLLFVKSAQTDMKQVPSGKE